MLGEDPLTDIAVIKIERQGLPIVRVGRSSDLMIGEWSIALGNPYSYLLGNAEPTVTAGVISATGRNILPTGEQNGLYLEGESTPGTNVQLKDVVVTQDRSPMGAGYMSLDKGEMKWTLTYDEIDIVLEGELVITRGSEQVRGGPGDTIYIPKSSATRAPPA